MNPNPSGQSEILRTRNESVVLSLYVPYILTPNDDLFFQNWVSFVYNTRTNSVLADTDGTSLERVEKLRDQHMVQVDAQVGYWLVNPLRSTNWLRGFAPFAEIHYNVAVGATQSVQAWLFNVGPINRDFHELNLVAGSVFQLGDRTHFSVGAVFPTLGQSFRTVEYQIGVRGNFFFGRTLHSRRLATYASAF